MAELKHKLSTYSEEFWNFNNFRNNGIHNIAKYPAVMVAPMQKILIKDIIEIEKNINNILDPFCGSGTTLVEGTRLGLKAIGIDINPLANLITKVKLEGVEHSKMNEAINNLHNRVINWNGQKLHYFNNIGKWFRDDIIIELTKIRESIMLEKDERIRRYFWVCFSDIVRKYSNTRSTTFKLHIKDREDILSMRNNVIEDFFSKIKNSYRTLPTENLNKHKLFLDDSTQILKKFPAESIDLICTSPPYGDNNTTVTYGQFSILSLLWIDIKDCNDFNKDIISNYSRIDTLSLGGGKIGKVELGLETVSNILKKITLNKQKKVKKFMFDYEKVFKEMARVTKKGSLIVLTLGNRRVDNVEIPLDEISIEIADKNKMALEVKLERNIPCKRMPKKVSNVRAYGAVSSINKEKVLIFRKN